MENESFKELAKNFEKSLEKKDETISDLTSRVQSYQNKIHLQKYFFDWKIKHSEVTREVGSGSCDHPAWKLSVFDLFLLYYLTSIKCN